MLINIDHLEYKKYKTWLRVWKKDHSDGIGWDELQAVKNLAFGKESVVIEIYPAESKVVNFKNIRHLWLVPNDSKLPDLNEIVKYFRKKA